MEQNKMAAEMTGPPVLGGAEENKKEPKEEADMEADLSQEELDKAAAVREALNAGDDEDFAMALKNFISVCGGY